MYLNKFKSLQRVIGTQILERNAVAVNTTQKLAYYCTGLSVSVKLHYLRLNHLGLELL